MKLGMVGTSYKANSLKDIEKIYISPDAIELFFQTLPPHHPLKEWVILATCNRMEIYFVAENVEEAAEWLITYIASNKRLSKKTVQEILEFKQEDQALNHLFRVASSLESMVLGENEILGQVKDAYDRAKRLGMTGPLLNKCFQTAVSTGKKVRTDTHISRGAYSVSSIAVEALRERVLDYFQKKIMVVGAGLMGERILRHLYALGHPNLTVANRNIDKAKLLGEKYNADIFPLKDALLGAGHYDIFFFATATPQYLLTSSHFEKPVPGSKWIVDLGVPRNVDPDIAVDHEFPVLTVTGLKEIANKNMLGRKGEISHVESIISAEMNEVDRWNTYREKIHAGHI